MQTFLVDENSRLDIFLAKNLKQSRNQIALLIQKNCIKINDKIENKKSFKLKNGDRIIVNFPSIKECESFFDVDFEVEILYEDEDLLVLNKPSNLVVHGAKSVRSASLVDWLVKRQYTLSTLAGQIRAGLVHRLDKDTSGAILIAKNNFIHKRLSEQLRDRSMGRIYLALIDLPLKEDRIVIDKALFRSNNNAMKKVAISTYISGSKQAKSAFVNLIIKEGLSLIGAKLFTGRTHQIRAHLASINRHILGDKLYGYRGKYEGRVMLHAYFLYFIHPKSGAKILVQAPLMNDFKQILEQKMILGELYEKISFEFLLKSFDF